MMAIAETYHKLGIPIIPFFIDPAADHGVHDKKPKILTYKKWETTRKQTKLKT